MLSIPFRVFSDETDQGAAPVIRSGAEIDYPPFSFVDEHGRANGFSVELMRAALAAMGRDVSFRTGPWPKVRQLLEQAEVDALPLVGRTPERESLFDFTVPYMSLHGAIVIRNTVNNIQDLKDLKGRTVAVMKGDNADEFLRREARGIKIITRPSFAVALKELSEGHYDAVVIQRLVAIRLIRETGLTDLRVIGQPIEGFKQDFCFAVHEGDRETLALLNEGLAIVVADGTHRRLHSRWFAAMQLPSDRPIIIGGDRNFPPFEFLDKDGRPAGYNVDLTWAIAREMGLNIEIRLGGREERHSALKTGKIDVMQGMSYSPARNLTFGFTQPHTVCHYVAVIRKGEGAVPASLKELKSRHIVVEKGDLLYDILLENGLNQQMTAVVDQKQALQELSEGEHDCAVVSRVTALFLIEKNGWKNLVLGKKPLIVSEHSYATSKADKAILTQFSEGLNTLEKSGEYRRIHDKWLGVYKNNTTSFKGILKYLALFVGPLLFLLLIILVWSWFLRRKVAEKTRELKNSEEQLKAVISCSPVALYTIDFEGTVLSWNRSAENMFGWPAEEIVGRALPTIPDDQKDEFDILLQSAFTGKTILGKELVRMKKEHTLFSMRLSAALAKNEQDKPVSLVCAAEDITEQKRSLSQIEHLNQVLRTIRDINQLIVHERDMESLIEEGCRLLVANRGYASAMILLTDKENRPFFWSVQGRATASDDLIRLFEQGKLPICLEQTGDREGGLLVKNRKTVCSGCPIAQTCQNSQPLRARLTHEGRHFGYVAAAAEKTLIIDEDEKKLFKEMAKDFAYALSVMKGEETHRKVEVERKKLKSQLLHSQKMEFVGRLAGGVAHDYNNMLSVIIGFSELALSRTKPGEELHDDLQEILNAARRSADITRQLLAFARRQTIAPKVLDLNKTIENMLKMLHRLMGENIDLSWRPGPGLWSVKMDPSQLDQIFANLCVNARDAIPDVGKVIIETDNFCFDEDYCAVHPGFLPGEYVRLAVSDNGHGMDPNVMEKLFEPFFTTKATGKGTGLGLATVYGIVKQNKGFINVYSEPGKGSTFRIYLPRETHPDALAEQVDVNEIPLGSGETILVTEDEPSILTLAKTILEHHGYSVLTAAGPGEAMALSKDYQGRIHLLITDVVLPEMNGRELAEQMQSSYPELKVLFMSGYTANVIAHQGVLEKGVHFISKPFSRNELISSVQRALK